MKLILLQATKQTNLLKSTKKLNHFIDLAKQSLT